MMKGSMILLVFFGLFAAASLLIPAPMFPGSTLCSLIGGPAMVYVKFVSAFFNGMLYGGILSLFFISLSKRFAQEK